MGLQVKCEDLAAELRETKRLATMLMESTERKLEAGAAAMRQMGLSHQASLVAMVMIGEVRVHRWFGRGAIAIRQGAAPRWPGVHSRPQRARLGERALRTQKRGGGRLERKLRRCGGGPRGRVLVGRGGSRLARRL